MKFYNVIQLIKIIGSPYERTNFSEQICEENVLKKLLPISQMNKIPLLYLENIMKKCNKTPELYETYLQYKQKNEAIMTQLKNVSEIFRKKNVEYAVFKTLKPYPFIGSDIDLLFFSFHEYKKGYNLLMSHDYKIKVRGPQSVTLTHPTSVINIDLHKEIAASYIVYIDKMKLREQIRVVNFDGAEVSTLKPEADLVVSMNHSLYKEQLYTLADFYTILYYFAFFSKKQFDNYVELIKNLNAQFTIKLIVNLTQALYLTCFGDNALKHSQLCKRIFPTSNFLAKMEVTRLMTSKEMPFRYNPITVVASLITKLKDQSTCYSLGKQLVALSDSRFLRKFLIDLASHTTHKTY